MQWTLELLEARDQIWERVGVITRPHEIDKAAISFIRQIPDERSIGPWRDGIIAHGAFPGHAKSLF